MKVNLHNTEYTFLIGYQKDEKLRAAFNQLAEKIFGISFENWYRAGYWNEKYIPYTLFDGEKAVANVSANVMDFNVLGLKQRYIQIGTVMTDPDYRGNNLSRFLMEKVLADWNEKCDLVYLYANKSVLQFYPKFGFSHVKEHEYIKTLSRVVTKNDNHDIEKVDMDLKSNRDFFYNYSKNSAAFSQISMQENADLAMFYCTSFLKDNIYHIKSLGVIVVATVEGNQLHVFDIFGKFKVDLDAILDALGGHLQIDGVLLGFTPDNCTLYEVREIKGDDALFVQQRKVSLFDDNKVMFPLLSHA